MKRVVGGVLWWVILSDGEQVYFGIGVGVVAVIRRGQAFAVIGELGASRFALVTLWMDGVSSTARGRVVVAVLRGRGGRVIGGVLSVGGEVGFRIGIRVLAVIRRGRAFAVIGELGASRFALVTLSIGGVTSTARGWAVVAVVPSVGGDIDFRIGDRVMAVICRGIFVGAWAGVAGPCVLVGSLGSAVRVGGSDGTATCEASPSSTLADWFPLT